MTGLETEFCLNQKPELSDLCEHVRTLNWYQLGIQLEIDSIYLDEIMCDNKSEDMKRMKMFEVWLRTNPKASVGQLVEALRRKSVQENAIADEFEQIYKSHDTGIFTITIVVMYIIKYINFIS